jgi:hypothetical protein
MDRQWMERWLNAAIVRTGWANPDERAILIGYGLESRPIRGTLNEAWHD